MDRRFHSWLRCGRIYPRGHRGDQAISPTHYVSDIRGTLGVVAESAPEGGHSAIYRVRGNHHILPYQVYQLVDADHVAGALGEADK
jgi:hypothetical protein